MGRKKKEVIKEAPGLDWDDPEASRKPAEDGEEKAELFKQREVDPVMVEDLKELFPEFVPDVRPETEGEGGTNPHEPEPIGPEDGTNEAGEETTDPETPEPETGEDPGNLPRIEKHTETQTLKCILTETEIKAAGDLMARADGERVDAESTLKSVSAQYKAKIASAEAVVSAEASKIRSGYEFRPVEVRVEYDHDRGTVEKFRTDTFECIESRRMTEYEAQRKIRF